MESYFFGIILGIAAALMWCNAVDRKQKFLWTKTWVCRHCGGTKKSSRGDWECLFCRGDGRVTTAEAAVSECVGRDLKFHTGWPVIVMCGVLSVLLGGVLLTVGRHSTDNQPPEPPINQETSL